jgi:hypothetical protein
MNFYINLLNVPLNYGPLESQMVAKWFVRQTMNTPGMEQGGKLGAASKDTVVLTLKYLPYLLPHTA